MFKTAIMALLVLAHLATTVAARAQDDGSTPECQPAAGMARVSVGIAGSKGAPGNLRYRLTNTYSSPVSQLLLGTGEGDSEMRIIPDNLPEKILAPPGWRGQSIFEEESEYMHVLWEAENSSAAVPPRRTLEGYAVEMPRRKSPGASLFDSQGKPVKPLDMTKAPFTVYFTDGSCAWGRVELERK